MIATIPKQCSPASRDKREQRREAKSEHDDDDDDDEEEEEGGGGGCEKEANLCWEDECALSLIHSPIMRRHEEKQKTKKEAPSEDGEEEEEEERRVFATMSAPWRMGRALAAEGGRRRDGASEAEEEAEDEDEEKAMVGVVRSVMSWEMKAPTSKCSERNGIGREEGGESKETERNIQPVTDR